MITFYYGFIVWVDGCFRFLVSIFSFFGGFLCCWLGVVGVRGLRIIL